jgi:stage II sporulation protein D (peptidoglycan lytic transglycosylase)
MSCLRGVSVLLLLSLVVLLAGCVEEGPVTVLPKGVPMIRVRLMQDCREVAVAGTERAWARSGADISSKPVEFPRAPGATVRLNNGTWMAGGIPLGNGELTITPVHEGAITVQGQAFRGRYRFVPVSPMTFDVINDVDIDGYLKGVLAEELYPGWHDQTYRAQAIIARTYAIYESRTAGQKRYWDVYADTRSQMYKGLAGETSRAIRAVTDTAGLVVAAGPPGQERIFKTYFSSCCGGRTQSARDAFGDEYTAVLGERKRAAWCQISPKYNWEGARIRKDEIARRIGAWAKRKSDLLGTRRPELSMVGVAKVEQAYVNSVGRPVMFRVTDTRGQAYLMRGEDLRLAIATEAPKGGATVYSADFSTRDEGDVVWLTDGHGYGHGVGMCQWCAQGQAMAGWRHEDIAVDAYPGSKLIRAY